MVGKQLILQQLSDKVSVDHFEVIKPTLHEIFLRIAKPSTVNPAAPGSLAEIDTGKVTL